VIVASGVLVSVYVIIQMFSGFQLLAMRMEDLEFSKNPGVTRSITGVSIYIQGYAMYWLGIQALSSKKYKLLSLILLLVGVLGVLGTYTRGAWIALGVGGVLVAYLYGRMRGVFAYTSFALISLALVLGGMFVVKPKVANALVDRFAGIGQEISGGASFGWRLRENQAALDAMEKHPLMGVGLGGAYKPNLQTAGGFMNDEYFIHNSYLSVPTKMGLPGLFMMLYVFFEYFKRFLKAYKNPAFWGRTENIVGFGVMAAFMIGGIEGPTLAKFEGALLYCILLYGITMLSREPESLT
jgi:O-antigen ligase